MRHVAGRVNQPCIAVQSPVNSGLETGPGYKEDRLMSGLCAQRNWVCEAVRRLNADFNRSSDTHLIRVDLPLDQKSRQNLIQAGFPGKYLNCRRVRIRIKPGQPSGTNF